ENAFILVIRGEKPEIYIQAVYEPDMTIPYLVVGIVAVAVITTLVVLLLKKKSQNTVLEKPRNPNKLIKIFNHSSLYA
ncbi:MAG: hypothetical protein DRJ35_04160, partial [Thermoprotei archaeon]